MTCTISFLSKVAIQYHYYCEGMSWVLQGIYIGRKEYREFLQSRLPWEEQMYDFEYAREDDFPTFKLNGVSFYVVDRPKSYFFIAIDKHPERSHLSLVNEIINNGPRH